MNYSDKNIVAMVLATSIGFASSLILFKLSTSMKKIIKNNGVDSVVSFFKIKLLF